MKQKRLFRGNKQSSYYIYLKNFENIESFCFKGKNNSLFSDLLLLIWIIFSSEFLSFTPIIFLSTTQPLYDNTIADWLLSIRLFNLLIYFKTTQFPCPNSNVPFIPFFRKKFIMFWYSEAWYPNIIKGFIGLSSSVNLGTLFFSTALVIFMSDDTKRR